MSLHTMSTLYIKDYALSVAIVFDTDLQMPSIMVRDESTDEFVKIYAFSPMHDVLVSIAQEIVRTENTLHELVLLLEESLDDEERQRRQESIERMEDRHYQLSKAFNSLLHA